MMLKVIIFIIVLIAILIYIINPQALEKVIEKVKSLEKTQTLAPTPTPAPAPAPASIECEGTYSPMNWTDWTNDSNCPLPTNYTIGDSAFNITQSRTGKRTFTILNPNSLNSNYSCPQKKDINIKETRDFTCPRNCLGSWAAEFAECNVACPDNPLKDGDNLTWTKTNKGTKTEQIAPFIISKKTLGTGVVCDKDKSKDCSASVDCPYLPTKIQSVCPDGAWRYLDANGSNQCTSCQLELGHIIDDIYCKIPLRSGYYDYYRNNLTNRICPSGYTDKEKTNMLCTKDCKSGYTYNETTKLCSRSI